MSAQYLNPKNLFISKKYGFSQVVVSSGSGRFLTLEEATSLAVGGWGWKDHVHIFFGLSPTLHASDLLQKVKQTRLDGLMKRT